MKKSLKVTLLSVLLSSLLIGCNNPNEETTDPIDPSDPVEETISVTGISLSANNQTLFINDSFTLNYEISPSNASNQEVNWSYDSSYLTKENNTFIALKAGLTNITITTVDGGFTDTCTVTINERTISVTGVSLNETSLTMNAGDTYTLLATVNPTDATNKEVTWASSDSEIATINNGVVTAIKEGDAVITTTTVDGNFTATCAIHVNKAEPVITYVKAYIHDSYHLISSIDVKEDNEFVSYTDIKEEDGVRYIELPLNSEVRIGLTSNGDVEPTGLDINGEIKTLKEGYVYFKMNPGEDYDFLSLTPVYEIHAEKEYTFTFEATSHLTEMTIYNDESLRNVISSADSSETIYIKVASDDDDIFCRSLKAVYNTSDLSTSSKEATSLGNNVFSLVVPYSSYNKVIKLVPTEGNASMLRDTGLEGKYVVIQVPDYATKINSINTTNPLLTVTLDGTLTLGDNNRVSVVNRVNDDHTLYTNNYATLPYGEKYIFTSGAGSSNGLSSPYSTYDLLCVKMDKNTDKPQDYTVIGETFKFPDNTLHSVLSVYHNEELYFTFVVDRNKKTCEEDVTIDMFKGANVSDMEAMYEIYKNNETLLAVSFRNEGGISNRIPMESPLGKYVNGENVLLINYSNSAYLNGVKYVATISDSEVILTNANAKITIHLDFQNKAFVVVSEEEINKQIPDFRLKVFEGYVNDDGSNCYTKISFNDYASLDDAEATLMYRYSWAGAEYIAKFSISYDLDSDILTLSYKSSNYNWNHVGEALNAQMSDHTMTFLNSIFNLPFKNNSLTSEDFLLG